MKGLWPILLASLLAFNVPNLIVCQSPHSGKSRAAENNNVSAFRINSPRAESTSPEEESPGSGEITKAGVLVKLPPDLEAVLNLQKSDRSRHASILGLPTGGVEEVLSKLILLL